MSRRAGSPDGAALVVGAGSGIGRAVVDAFRERGRPGRRARAGRGQVRALAAEVTAGVPVVTRRRHDARGQRRGRRGGRRRLRRAGHRWSAASGSSTSTAASATSTPTSSTRRSTRCSRVNVKSHLHAVKAALPALRAQPRLRSCSPSRPRRTTRAAAGCSTCLEVRRPRAGDDPRPRAGARTSGSTGSPRAAPCTPTCAGREPRAGRAESSATRPDRAADLAARVPLHVALSGEDHAWSYVFLASERARGITGGVVHPDGGMAVKA